MGVSSQGRTPLLDTLCSEFAEILPHTVSQLAGFPGPRSYSPTSALTCFLIFAHPYPLLTLTQHLLLGASHWPLASALPLWFT